MREYGLVRVIGPQEAAPYVLLARDELGLLKERMQFNGHLVGAYTRYLPDGTRICVQSIVGADTVWIDPPSVPEAAPKLPELPEAPPPPEDVTTEVPEVNPEGHGLAVCGGYIINGLGNFPYIWHPGTGLVDIGGGQPGTAYAISEDGEMVVGESNSQAFVWTKKTGMQLIGAVGSLATGISRGHVVVGQDGGPSVGATTNRPATAFMWSRDTGLQFIHASAGMQTGNQVRPRISPNGKYISWSAGGGKDTVAVMERKTGAIVYAPVSAAGWGNAADVSDDGTVAIFSDQCYLWNCVSGETTPINMYQPYAISSDGKTVAGVALDANNNLSLAVYWTAETGTQVLGTDLAASVSPDGRYLGGSVYAYRQDAATIWHRKSGNTVAVTTIPTDHGAIVRGIAYPSAPPIPV